MATRPPYGQDFLGQGFVDLRQYASVLRRNKRFITWVVVGALAFASGYSFTRTPSYTAAAKVIVLPTGIDPAAAANAGPEKLVNLPTEAEIVASTEVAGLAAQAMHTSATPQSLLKHVTVKIPTDALVLQIAYSDPDPLVAQQGALAFADAYLQFKQADAEATVAGKIAALNGQIATREKRIVELNQIIATEPAGSIKGQNARTERLQLQSEIEMIQAKLGEQGAINTDPGQVVSKPGVPTHPSSPNHQLDLAIGLVLGLVVGVGGAFLRARTDDRLRERDQLAETIGAPVLAVIPKVPGWSNRAEAKLVTLQEPRSPASEAYRALRPTLLLASAQRGIKTIMVVSPSAGEGKTTTAANLAVVLAQADKSVVLVSADLRKPRLHEFFGLKNDRGLADVLLSGETQLWEPLKKSGVDNLWLLPSGPLPAQPAELLQSRAMKDLLEEQRAVVDFILLDCPPVLAVADALGLIPLVDAVLFVTDASTTKRDAVEQSRDQLIQMGATILGSVLNDLDPAASSSYYGYGYGDEVPGRPGHPSSNGKVREKSRRRDRTSI